MKFIYITMTQRAIGLLAGLSLIVFGVIVDTKSVTYLGFFMPSSGNFNPISISLQIVGALIFIVGFFGCCAASKGCFGAVVTFVVFLCILLLAQVTLAFTAIIYRQQMKEHIEAGWLSSMEEYGRSSQLSDAWNYIQQQGCIASITEWAVDNVVMILAIAAYVVVIQLIGIVLTSSLARKIRKECQDMADPEYSVKSDGIDSAG